MRRTLLIVLPLVTLLFACSGAGTKFQATWTNPEYKGANLDDVLVIGVAENTTNRRLYEAALVGYLTQYGVTAYQSAALLPSNERLSKEQVVAAVKENNIDAVIVTRLLGVQEEETYVPSSTTVYASHPSYGNPYYGSYYGYYNHSYEVVSSPGYTYTDVTVTLETNLYDASNEKIVWSGQSATFNPNSSSDVINPTADLIVQQMIDEGFIQSK